MTKSAPVIVKCAVLLFCGHSESMYILDCRTCRRYFNFQKYLFFKTQTFSCHIINIIILKEGARLLRIYLLGHNLLIVKYLTWNSSKSSAEKVSMFMSYKPLFSILRKKW